MPKKEKKSEYGIDNAGIEAPCCSTFWILIVVSLVLVLVGAITGVTLIFFPSFIYGTNSSVTPTPAPPTPAPTPIPSPSPTPTPTPPTPQNHTGPCCQTNERLPSCGDITISSRVCTSSGYESCCTLAWNLTCVKRSVVLGLQSCNPLDCCVKADSGNTQFVAGCVDLEIQNQVCAVDSSCCSRVWDKTCAGTAIHMGLQQCSIEDCCVPNAQQGCANITTTQRVCDIDSSCCTRSWAPNCVGVALRNNYLNGTCSTSPCCLSAVPGLNSNYLGCNDPDVNRLVCTEMQSCCSFQWTAECAAKMLNLSVPCIGLPENSCCNISSRGGCNEIEVMRKVCALQGREECCAYPHGWAADCISAAIKGPAPVIRCLFDSCCTVHSKPGCNNTNITEAVCSVLPGCCSTGWGQDCVDAVLALPGITAAECEFRTDCCSESDTPGCNNLDVVKDVCITQGLSFCCDSDYGWSQTCVRAALETGRIVCSNASCCIPADPFNPPLGCNDADLMEIVCSVDGMNDCCSTVWNTECAKAAIQNANDLSKCFTNANSSAFTGECCEITNTPGCNDFDVFKTVCATEDMMQCCTTDLGWNAQCVTAGITSGALSCNQFPCTEPYGNAGCTDSYINAGVCGNIYAERTRGTPCYVETLSTTVQLKLESCCQFDCAQNSDCGPTGVCAGNRCCATNNQGICENCGCTAPVAELSACGQTISGDYYCPTGVQGACVIYEVSPRPEVIACCQQEYLYCTDSFYTRGWDEVCTFAGLCVGDPEDLNRTLFGDTDCCTETESTDVKGCNPPEIAAAVCALSLTGRTEFMGAAQCCNDATVLSSQGNLQYNEGWSSTCIGLAISQGLQVCSITSDCCLPTGTQGCSNATINTFVCNSTEVFLNSNGKPVDLLECCISGWTIDCINYFQKYNFAYCAST